MKMVKSLLLGSAAGLVAMAGASAADLPVKAKPVEYVKVCSIYGAGFYYIPGTDTCLKVGGFVRAEYNFNANGSHTPLWSGGAARDTRQDTPSYMTRTRGIISFDSRSQTEWGTLRAYIRAGWEMQSDTTELGAEGDYRGRRYFDRAFIQFAGLTVGKTQSFFDFYANALNYTTTVITGSDTGHGINLIAYTATFGGGFSATVSLEENTHRRVNMYDASTDAIVPGASPGLGQPNYGNYAAERYPDIVGNLRVDQPWGSAQIMGAIHDASASCYGAFCVDALGGNHDAADATGFAIGAGVKFNVPWAQGDELWLQGTYANGAASYIGFNRYGTTPVVAMYRTSGSNLANNVPAIGGSLGAAWAMDGVFQTGGPVELTEGFQFNAAFQHYWTPALRTSVFGGYSELHFPGTHVAAPGLGAPGVGTGARGAFCTGTFSAIFAANNVNGCNPDFSIVQVGTRTVWSPVRNLDIGVEVLYTRLDQNFDGTFAVSPGGGRAASTFNAKDQDTWSGVLRFQRNFWP
ncbi:MAG: porin [Rhizobiales bacterium]|nr:porin [Hyphomicrobiales bacterium]